MSLQPLEQRIRQAVLAGTLGAGIFLSGCETPEDYALVSGVLGIGGLNPALTPLQSGAIGVGRDLAGMGAGISSQRESSERIAGAIRGQGRYDAPPASTKTYRRMNTPQFGALEIYIGKTPLGYTGERCLRPEEITLQNTFTKHDSFIIVCGTEHKMRNMTVKYFDEQGTVLEERVISQGWTNGLAFPVEAENIKDVPTGHYAVAFYAMPSGAIAPKYQDTLLYLGSVEFTIEE